jgi:predicted PurR-regulated permease PerM
MSQSPVNSSSNGLGTRFLLASAALIILLAGLHAAQSIVSPFLLAVFLALILTPPLRWLKKKGLSDFIAILVLSAIVFLLGLGLVLVFSNSITHFSSKLPHYKEKITVGYTTIDTWINTAADKMSAFGMEAAALTEPPTEVGEGEKMKEPGAYAPGLTVDKQTPQKKLSLSNVIQVNTLISYVQTGANMLLNLATTSSLVIIMVVFMLIEAARMPDKVKEAFGGRDLSNEYFKKIADDTWNYMKIKTIICILTGVVTTIGLWFLNVEYAVLWGVLMFFLNYIPNIGPVIAAIPPILLALIDGGVLSATLVTAWVIFVNTVFGIAVEPRYLEQGLGISSLVVLLSLIFWGWLLGPVGMFLSAPLTMVMKIVLQNDPRTRWIAVLLSNR